MTLTENKGHSELSHMLRPPAPPPGWWFCRVWKCPSCNTILFNSCHVWPLVGLWSFSSKLDSWKIQFYYFLMPSKTFSILLLAFSLTWYIVVYITVAKQDLYHCTPKHVLCFLFFFFFLFILVLLWPLTVITELMILTWSWRNNLSWPIEYFMAISTYAYLYSKADLSLDM